LEQSKSEIEVKIIQEEMEKPLLTKDQILFWLHKFRGIDTSKLEQRQILIDTFVNAIYLYDDKIVFTFNFKDGFFLGIEVCIKNSNISFCIFLGIFIFEEFSDFLISSILSVFISISP